MLTPTDCPKFNRCDAPICPLDPRWRSAVHRWGEKVCFFLLASRKAGAQEHYADSPTFRAVLPLVGEIRYRHPDIHQKIARAATQPIKEPPVAGRRGQLEASLSGVNIPDDRKPIPDGLPPVCCAKGGSHVRDD